MILFFWVYILNKKICNSEKKSNFLVIVINYEYNIDSMLIRDPLGEIKAKTTDCKYGKVDTFWLKKEYYDMEEGLFSASFFKDSLVLGKPFGFFDNSYMMEFPLSDTYYIKVIHEDFIYPNENLITRTK